MRFRQRIRQLQQQLSSLTAAIINSDLNLPTQPGTIHSTDASYRRRASCDDILGFLGNSNLFPTSSVRFSYSPIHRYVQVAPIENNPREKLTYFSNNTTNLSQNLALYMRVFKQHILQFSLKTTHMVQLIQHFKL